ncbi:MAG: regulator, partial [Rhodothermia bacterium]|nr:regulator [Rhodothermia bacterium]
MLLTFASASAQVTSWTAHTSMRRVTDVAAAPDGVWASTTGGVFRVNSDGVLDGTLTAVQGLHAVGGSTIEFDEDRSVVWLGYSDGVLDRIDAQDLTVTSFLDLTRATQFTRKGINRIVVNGDSLLLCTDFGVVVFDSEKGEVRDSYSKFGSFAAATPVHDVVVAPDESGVKSFWVATEAGLAVAPVSSPNLQDPSQWSTEIPPVVSLRSVAVFDSQVYVGTVSDAFVRESAEFRALGLGSVTVGQLDPVGDLLIGHTGTRVLAIASDGSVSHFAIEGFASPVSVERVEGRLWVADFGGGLGVLPLPQAGTTSAQSIEQQFTPTGPYNGVFTDLFAKDGTLWAGGLLGGGNGFHRLADDGVWTDYVDQLVPELQGRSSYTSVSVDAQGNGWAASEGSGVAMVTTEGSVEVFDETNSSLRPVTGFPGFIIAGGIAGDGNGGVWATTRGSSTPLHYQSADGEWTGLAPMVGEGLTSNSTAYGKIFIDSFGQKWIIVREESSFGLVKGLAVLDSGASPTDPSDDSFRFFGNRGGGGQGLPSRTVTAVIEDRDGLVWVGTDEGLAFFVNTGVIARDPNAVAIWPQRADRSEGAFLFLGLPVNDLAVDPANRLWIATNDGVRLIQPAEGGYEEVLHLTKDNSPLLSDAVLAVEVVADRGEVFLATAEGLVSAQIDAVTAAQDVRDLFVYPNPVVLGSGDKSVREQVTIEGLVDETRMSIVTALGNVVTSLRTRGGRAVWDLRDEDGVVVPSGIYLVIAVGENGEGTAFGKVA